jgi:hypothetical protein
VVLVLLVPIKCSSTLQNGSQKKFHAIATGRLINIMDLEIGVKYPVVYGIHLITSFTFILNVSGNTNLKVFCHLATLQCATTQQKRPESFPNLIKFENDTSYINGGCGAATMTNNITSDSSGALLTSNISVYHTTSLNSLEEACKNTARLVNTILQFLYQSPRWQDGSGITYS